MPLSTRALAVAATAAAASSRLCLASAQPVTAAVVENSIIVDDNDFVTIQNTDKDVKLNQQLSTLPPCPLWSSHTQVGAVPWPVEHTGKTCDYVNAQSPAASHYLTETRHRTQDYLVSTGKSMSSTTPDERTWVCPEDDGTSAAAEATGEATLRTRWLVRNKFSGPVSVGWVNPRADFLEVSVFDTSVSPPHADPRTVIQPGQFKAVEGHHGDVFHVRELLPTGDGDGTCSSGGGSCDGEGGGGLTAGRILLRHRPGLTPILNTVNAPCPPSALLDPPPPIPPGNSQRRLDEMYGKNWLGTCNSLYKDFVNRAGCPIDVYYAGVSPLPGDGSGSTAIDGALKTVGGALNAAAGSAAPTCQEKFSFHLGINPTPANFVADWDSDVKAEGTYLTHHFVARLHHDPTVIVDEIVVDGDVVRDCPDKKKALEVGSNKVGEGVEADVEEKDDEEEEESATISVAAGVVGNNASAAVLLGGVDVPSGAAVGGGRSSARSEL